MVEMINKNKEESHQMVEMINHNNKELDQMIEDVQHNEHMQAIGNNHSVAETAAEMNLAVTSLRTTLLPGPCYLPFSPRGEEEPLDQEVICMSTQEEITTRI